MQDGYDVDIEEVKSADEIGTLSRAFRGLVEDLRERKRPWWLHALRLRARPRRAAHDHRAGNADGGGDAGGTEAPRPGVVFDGRYDVKELLGAGGMGVVYRAFDRELGEPVAIKTLRPELLVGDSVALERFKQEIRLARKISHRHVVRTYDLGEVNGMYYLTMEYVEGTSLKQLISSRGKLPLAVTLTIGKQLCRALEVAHEQGVIHRDIKPQNIVVEPNGFVKVMDFGIARLVHAPQGEGLTQEGVSIGTSDYMSPEQLSGFELTPGDGTQRGGAVRVCHGRLPFSQMTWR